MKTFSVNISPLYFGELLRLLRNVFLVNAVGYILSQTTYTWAFFLCSALSFFYTLNLFGRIWRMSAIQEDKDNKKGFHDKIILFEKLGGVVLSKIAIVKILLFVLISIEEFLMGCGAALVLDENYPIWERPCCGSINVRKWTPICTAIITGIPGFLLLVLAMFWYPQHYWSKK